MINKIQIDDINRKVLYKTAHGEIEEGVIKSFNSAYIFVRFSSDVHSKACRREDLEFINAHDK